MLAYRSIWELKNKLYHVESSSHNSKYLGAIITRHSYTPHIRDRAGNGERHCVIHSESKVAAEFVIDGSPNLEPIIRPSVPLTHP
jgi:hypothetical protein